MPSSYTSSLRLVLPVTGELTGTWGDTVNNGLTELVEDAIAGTAAITMTDANLTLSTANEAADQARCMFISLSGGSLTATRDVICPSVSKLYVVLNGTSGGQSIRFKTAAGSGVTIPNGSRALLYCDGTNVTNAIGLPPLSGTGSNGSVLSSLGALAAGTQAKTANYTVVEGDRGDVIFCTNTITLWLNAAATLGDGFSFGVVNAGSGSITLDPSGAELIDGQSTKVLTAGQSLFVVTDGTGWRTVGSSTTQSQLPINQARIDVASASNVDLTTLAPATDHINITGTTTISSFSLAIGRLIFVRFAGALTLMNNASIVTQTGSNIGVQAGDTCILRATGTNVVEVLSFREARWGQINGAAPLFPVRTWIAFNGTGTPAASGSGNISSITDNGVGDYTVNFATALPSTGYSAVFSVGFPYTGGSAASSRSVGILAKGTSAIRFVVWDGTSAGTDLTDVNMIIVI